jgi:thymidine phosphorylase
VLGAGRDRAEDPVDHGVGIRVLARRGDQVAAGDPVLELHYRDPARLTGAIALASQALIVGDAPLEPAPLIVGEVGA